MTGSIPRWQMAGFLFTSAAGTFLHFLFDLTGQNWFAALFSAVNESIWEHMKLIFFPMLLFALAESRFIEKDAKFWCIKLAGIALALLLIPVLYYTYTGILGTSADWFNITIFFIAAATAFYLETRLLTGTRGCPIPVWASGTALLLIGVSFLLLTFFPPHIPLFEDPVTGQYGCQSTAP